MDDMKPTGNGRAWMPGDSSREMPPGFRRPFAGLFALALLAGATIIVLTVSGVIALSTAVNGLLGTAFALYLYRPRKAWSIYLRYLDSRERRLRESESRPEAPRSRRRITAAPGSLLLRFATFWFSPKSVEMVLRPAVDDLRLEYYEALLSGNRVKAKWVRIRDTLAVLKAAGLLKLVSAAKLLVRLWRMAG